MNTLPFPKQSDRKGHCDLILKALQSGERLTCLQILDRFQCNSGKQRVWDLRESGWNVKGEWIKTPSKKRIVQWYLDPNDLFSERNSHKKEKSVSISRLKELAYEWNGAIPAEHLKLTQFIVWLEGK